MFYKLTILVILLAGTQAGQNDTKDEILQAEIDLRKDLLKNYDKTNLPKSNMNVTFIEISLQKFQMLEESQTMDVVGRVSLIWEDPRLMWDMETHKNVGILGMDPKEIWTPDLAVYDGMSQTHMPRSSLPMIVYPTEGVVSYVSLYELHFVCVMDLTYWPHDSHECSLKVGSWVHQGHMIDLLLKNNTAKITIPPGVTSAGQNLSGTEWLIKDTSVSRETSLYPCCHEPLVSIVMKIVVERNAHVYSWTVKLPVACLSLLTALMFLLPPSAAEKLIFGVLCLIADLIYIVYSSTVISLNPSHTPLIIRLVSQQVVLVTLSLIVSALTLRLARDPQATGLPSFVKKVLVLVSYPLCLRNYRNLLTYSSHVFSDDKTDEFDLEERSTGVVGRHRFTMEGREWIFLSAILDRLALIIFAAVSLISLITFSQVL